MWTENRLVGRRTYNFLVNPGIPNRKVTSQPASLFSLCKANRQNVNFLIRLDCTSYNYNHGCYTNSEAGATKESLSCHTKADSEKKSEIKQLSNTFSVSKTQKNFLKKLELEEMRRPKIQGMITTSRVKWHEEGKKCSKYFLALEKRNAIRNSLQLLKVDGRLITKKMKF